MHSSTITCHEVPDGEQMHSSTITCHEVPDGGTDAQLYYFFSLGIRRGWDV
jgi:hypothetical protein